MFIFQSICSIVCRHNALGCQGKQHLSVINRVTAWKEEALGLILISLPRSELGRCWTAAGSSSLSPQPHPPCDTWDTDKWSPSVSLRPWSYVWAQVVRVQSLSQCCEPWMSGQLSKARWRPGTEAAGGVNVLVIIQLMALCCQHLRLGDPERDQTTSQLHYLDHTTLNLHKYWEPSTQWHAHNW